MLYRSLTYILFWLLGCSFSLLAQDIRRIDGSTIDLNALDQKIAYLQKAANVHGIAVTIFSPEEVLYEQSLGWMNAKENLPLKSTHTFYAASLSKAVFAYLVLRLVDEGVLSLDEPLVNYLDKPLPEYPFDKSYEGYADLADDDRYKTVTARMCLSHTSGLPNWRYLGKSGINMDNALAFEFDPGSTYNYSGEGIQLLQFVIEEITEKSLEELVTAYVFEPFGMKRTSFLWQDKFEGNYVVGHHKKKKIIDRRKRTVEYAAGSMETTPRDYTKFLQRMLRGHGLREETYRAMITQQVAISSTQQFGGNRFKETDANRDIELGYGLGWGVYRTPHGKAVFKEGHLKGWEHYAAFYPDSQLGILIMTNSTNGESIFKELLEFTVGDTWLPWYWQNYFPYDFRK